MDNVSKYFTCSSTLHKLMKASKYPLHDCWMCRWAYGFADELVSNLENENYNKGSGTQHGLESKGHCGSQRILKWTLFI